MISKLKSYSAMIPSGITWLGDIPEKWEVRRLRASVRSSLTGVWGFDPNGRDDIDCVRVADFDRFARRVRSRTFTLRAVPESMRAGRLLHRGDLLIEKSGGGELQPVGAVVLYDRNEQAVCSNFIARLASNQGYLPTYLAYLHATLYSLGLNIRSIKQTTGIQNLDGQAYLNEYVAFPYSRPLLHRTRSNRD